MSRTARAVACVAALALPLAAVAGCGPDDVDARCAKDSCTLHARSGTSIEIGHLALDVKEVSDSYVKLGSHGVSLKLVKGLDLRLGSHRLHLAGTEGGTADIEVS
ncbi:hypothetical protein ACSNOK_14890 [Streptomyces sp. URMC 126]|uniref:hypothetical protein n=1 Tax=Streptomyces sp. URMC 126 TaxID=3423401 RepID=UPI003F1CE050